MLAKWLKTRDKWVIGPQMPFRIRSAATENLASGLIDAVNADLPGRLIGAALHARYTHPRRPRAARAALIDLRNPHAPHSLGAVVPHRKTWLPSLKFHSAFCFQEPKPQ
jgi:hypothetical protein